MLPRTVDPKTPRLSFEGHALDMVFLGLIVAAVFAWVVYDFVRLARASRQSKKTRKK